MDIKAIRNFVKEKTNSQPQELTESELGAIMTPITNSEARDYLRFCLPLRDYQSSGVAVLSRKSILAEMHPHAAPGGLIKSYGYVTIASSAGGNAVCLDANGGEVLWADHEGFANGLISYKDRRTGQWVFCEEYTPENVRAGLVLITSNLEQFLRDLITEKIAAELEKLDLS